MRIPIFRPWFGEEEVDAPEDLPAGQRDRLLRRVVQFQELQVVGIDPAAALSGMVHHLAENHRPDPRTAVVAVGRVQRAGDHRIQSALAVGPTTEGFPVQRGAELHVVDGGHAPWLHHADQIAPLATAFLSRPLGINAQRRTDTTT